MTDEAQAPQGDDVVERLIAEAFNAGWAASLVDPAAPEGRAPSLEEAGYAHLVSVRAALPRAPQGDKLDDVVDPAEQIEHEPPGAAFMNETDLVLWRGDKYQDGHDMAPVNYNTLRRLIRTIDYWRDETVNLRAALSHLEGRG